MKIILNEKQYNNLILSKEWFNENISTKPKKIIITENQFSRILLKETELGNLKNIMLEDLPKPNAGDIQRFLKKKGFYTGKIDWDFGDASAKAFSIYFYGKTNYRTVKKLYEKLKEDGYDVGKTSGFGQKMANVISSLIEEKEKKNFTKVQNDLKKIQDELKKNRIDVSDPKLLYNKEYFDDFTKNYDPGSDRLGPDGQFQPFKAFKQDAFGGRHDDKCTDAWRKKCKSQGMVASNKKRKGKEWDILSGRATRLSNGEYSTAGWGEWDNEDITKCRCQRGKVISTPRIASNWNELEDKFEMVTVYDEKFIPEGASYRQLNIIPGSMEDKYLKNQISEKDYHQYQQGKLRKFSREAADLDYSWAREHKHEILDVLSIAVLILPGGVFISAGIDLIHAGIRYNEGDTTGALIDLASAIAIPGIGAAYKLSRGPAKTVAKSFIELDKQIGKGVAKETAIEDISKKLVGKEKEAFVWMAKNPDEVKKAIPADKLNNAKYVKNYVKQNQSKILDGKLLDATLSPSRVSKMFKHTYSAEFLTSIPLKIRSYITGGGLLLHLLLRDGAYSEEIADSVVENNMSVQNMTPEQKKIVKESVKNQINDFIDAFEFSPQTEEWKEGELEKKIEEQIQKVIAMNQLPMDTLSNENLEKISNDGDITKIKKLNKELTGKIKTEEEVDSIIDDIFNF